MQLRRSSDLEITNRAHAPLLLLLLSLMLAVLTSISALEETGGHKFKRGLEATAVLLHFKSSWCHWSHWPYVGALLGTAHALNLVVREVGMTGVGDLRGGTCGGHIQASDTRVCLLFLLWLAAIGVCLWCVFKWVSHRTVPYTHLTLHTKSKVLRSGVQIAFKQKNTPHTVHSPK